MRRGLTLIELIFSMVIIAIVFTVVPKIIFASNKSLELSMKEDALFSAYSLMGSIIKLDWDENTTKGGKILDTNDTICTDYKVGGFVGSRNCIDSNLTASAIGQDNGSSDYNDIDDYNNYPIDINKTVNGNKVNEYKVTAHIHYVDSNYAIETTTRNLKEINVTVVPGNNNTKMTGFKSSFFYYSANLGHIQVKKRVWQP